ncbi:MAG: DUF433 domain-containing protein [Leptolyngbya sp. SIO4C1]|nr:DUF433 domain-containing protein [Leptolyngbya sp. SIO4C1]
MQAAVDIGTLIVCSEGVLGKRPHIKGARVSVQRVAAWYKKGLTAEEVAERIGTVSLAQVYAALTYYHANQAEIEGYLAAEKAAYERAASENQSL